MCCFGGMNLHGVNLEAKRRRVIEKVIEGMIGMIGMIGGGVYLNCLLFRACCVSQVVRTVGG